MIGRNRMILTVGIIVTLVLIASYLMYGDESDETTIGVGDRMDYLVFGNLDTGEVMEGTSSWTLLEETDDQYRFEMTQSVYLVGTGGGRIPIAVGTETEWVDRTSGDDGYVAEGTVEVGTFWGKKTLGCYATEDGATRVLADGDLIYAFMYEGDGYTMYMELEGCTALGEKRADRGIHTVVIGMEMEAESDGFVFTGTEVVEIDNGRTEIFKEATETAAMYMEGYGQLYSATQRSWYDPFDGRSGMVMTGTVTIDTVWGEETVDVYETIQDGQTITMYVHGGGIPLRLVIEQDGTEFEFDTTTITLDGGDVGPEDVDLKSLGFGE